MTAVGARPQVPQEPQEPTARQVLRFAALGDSLTAGLGDPLPGGGWRGWAALLAEGLTARAQDTRLVNVSASGALTADVAGSQLARVRLVRPHLASVLVGVNDTLRGSYDIRGIAQHLHTVLGVLREDGTVVLTACLPDPGQMLGLPEVLARPLARRMRAVNTVVHALSERHRAVHVHLAKHSWVTDRAVWSVDRLHPSELGHRLIAREVHSVLVAGVTRRVRRPHSPWTGRGPAGPPGSGGWRPAAPDGSRTAVRICCPISPGWRCWRPGTRWRAPTGCWTFVPGTPRRRRSPHSKPGRGPNPGPPRRWVPPVCRTRSMVAAGL